MLGSPILDLAIGMAFIYLLLSLIASTIQEFLSAVVQARSANLEHGIRSLFSGGMLEKGEAFVDLIYQHGLVRGLYQDPHLVKKAQAVLEGKTIAAVQKPSPVREWLRRRLGVVASQLKPSVASDPFLLPAYIPARTFAVAMIDILNPDKLQGDPLVNIEQRLNALCTAAEAVEGAGKNNAAQAILSLLADAQAGRSAELAAERFKSNLENWYNDAMDRVSGWYKKYTQRILLVLGLVLAIVFNVDSVHIAKTLWFDRDARQGLVSAANSYVEKNTPALSGQQAADPDSKLSPQDLTNRMRTTVQAFNDVGAEYLLPLGWKHSLTEYKEFVKHPKEWNVIHMLEQMLGWLVTAFALSFGAPFWFDLLNKFMVVRSTVKPQEKSMNEVSKS